MQLVDHLKDKERHTFEELRTGPMRSDGGGDETIRLASTHIKRGKQKYYDRVFMAGLMRLSSKFNDTAAGTREKLYDFLSLALNKDREWVEKVFPLPKKTQMDAYKRASGRALRMVETRKLADYLPYSMEIDGASILRSNREMIHINLPVSNKMPVAERIVAGLYLVASTSGVDTANILQVAASEFGANLATMRTFSSDSTASMDTALGELQRLKRIAVGKLLADGIAKECTVFANCEIPELDKYFFN